MGQSVVSHRVESMRRVIKPSKGWASLQLGEVWRYHELLYFLVWRDVKVRYKQAVLGVLWAVLQPVITMVVFTLVFSRFLGVQDPDDDVPYAVYTYAALLPWQLFSGALGRAGTSLVGNASLLTKVYFPRLVIPLSAVLAGLVDFVLAFIVYLILMGAYGMLPGWQVVFLPLLVVLALLTALAFGLWLSALNVLYRDVQYIIPFMIQLWMFLSPIAYPPPTGTSFLTVLYSLNPLVGVIQGFRWALIGGDPPSVLLAVSTGIVLVLLGTGLMYFRRMERTFADVV